MYLQYLDTITAFVVILLAVSLLITILIQMVSSLFALRGKNLLWGVSTLLETAEPGLKEKAKKVATEVLTHSAISDSIFSKHKWVSLPRWRLAQAISPESLARGLAEVAAGMRERKQKFENMSDAEKNAVRADPKKAADLDYQTKAPDLIDSLLNAVDPHAARKAEALQTAVRNLNPNYVVPVEKIVQQLRTSANESVGKLDAWFNIIMKRTAQRFAMHTRIWTVVFAVLIAVVAHLDAFRIWNQLWTTPTLRASVAQITPDLLKEASSILPGQSGTDRVPQQIVSSPKVLHDAMENMVKKYPKEIPDAGTIPGFSSLDGAVKWLRTHLKSDDSAKEGRIEEYTTLVFSEHANAIRQQLEGTGLQLIPHPYSPLSFGGFQNILGIFIFVGFLSLGAPFWYNVLKNLANLRSMVSIRQDEQQKSSVGS